MKTVTQPSNSFLQLIFSAAFMLFLGGTIHAQQPFITTWKTDNPGTSNSTSITIPTTGGGYNYDVDWDNDGIYDQMGITGNVTHDFGVAGTYTIRVRGAFPRIYFNNGGDRLKLLTVAQWGTGQWSSMQNAFYGCANLNITATDLPNLSGVAGMQEMFRGCTMLNGPANIGDWNTATVTNMFGLFYGATVFNQPIGNWNTAAVTNMVYMFQNATSFNQPIGNWTLNSGVDLTFMLNNCGMACLNYSATLIGWAANPATPNGRSLGASGRQYGTNAVAARNTLLAKGWTITGDVASGAVCAPCPTFSGAPGEVVINNGACGAGCELVGASISAPTAGCPAQSTLQYSVNGGGWTNTLPTYADELTIKTRCVCDTDDMVVSPESTGVTTNAAANCTDTDGDGVADCIDNCIETLNPGQEDSDGDGIGDVCDACPTIPDPNCSSCGNNKYLVCHIPAGNPENAQQLCLPLNAANTHIGNHGGCFFGLCSPGSSSAGYSNNDNEVVETPSGAAYYFEIAPNPTTGSVSIHLHGHEAGAHLYIRNQMGRLVWSQPLDAEESMFNISLEDHRFANGIYYVSVFNNGENITKRLVVAK